MLERIVHFQTRLMFYFAGLNVFVKKGYSRSLGTTVFHQTMAYIPQKTKQSLNKTFLLYAQKKVKYRSMTSRVALLLHCKI